MYSPMHGLSTIDSYKPKWPFEHEDSSTEGGWTKITTPFMVFSVAYYVELCNAMH